ncbi:hypothetical protein AWB78_05988 [Caballeronia calidae]|uniref:Uncharacterized protein n=1 Tax=Caballeronia calidae TaxID=1777139 RepID=A0A158E168_9BURK|nr:hypothetical protein [Caballeronia calidae]SAL00641.1 hypothetical protein AWB78_05988 [Caballeronia calidae]
MKHELRTALLSLAMTVLAPCALAAASAAHAQTDLAGDVSSMDALLAQQNGYVGNPAGGARLRPGARNADAKSMMMPRSAAATLYPAPPGLKPPVSNAARARDIYKSPY